MRKHAEVLLYGDRGLLCQAPVLALRAQLEAVVRPLREVPDLQPGMCPSSLRDALRMQHTSCSDGDCSQHVPHDVSHTYPSVDSSSRAQFSR